MKESFSILPSHPKFEQINALANEITIRKNPQMFFDMKGFDIDLPENKADLLLAEDKLEKILEGAESWTENPEETKSNPTQVFFEIHPQDEEDISSFGTLPPKPTRRR